jgi:hypothetical protein
VIVCCLYSLMMMVLNVRASQLWKKMVPWMRMALLMGVAPMAFEERIWMMSQQMMM